jgi:hypothetical protein
MLCGINFCFNLIRDVMLVGVSDKRNSEDRQQPVRFKRRKPLAASIMPPAAQRSAIPVFRHRFTLLRTRRTVPIMFLMELVQASERRCFAGSLRRLTVSISSSCL